MKKYYTQIMTFILGSFFSYFLYRISKDLNFQGGLRSVVSSVVSYPIIVKDSNPITLGKIMLGIFLLVLGNLCSHFISSQFAKKVLPKFSLDQGAIAAIKNLTFYVLNVLFALFALNMANVPLTAFTVVGGALAIGVGFGSQNLMSNFISGIIIQIERPIKVGDMIEIEGTRGVVEEIKSRRTVIRATNGLALIYPNAYFLDKKLSSYSFLSTEFRSDVKIVVPIGVDVNRLKIFVEALLESYPDVLKQPKAGLYFSDYSDIAPTIKLSASYWVDIKLSSKSELESKVRYAIYNELERIKTEEKQLKSSNSSSLE
jgi:potassium efflux system protein